MTCPQCGTDNMDRVIRTSDFGQVVMRQRECRCGIRWTTQETRLATSSTQLPTPANPCAPVARGVGGALSVVRPESDLSSPISNSVEVLSKRRRRSQQEMGYTPAFEAFWAIYPRHVDKDLAFRAWKAKGLEEKTGAVMAGLRSQLAFYEGKERDKVPHATTWINRRRWEAPAEDFKIGAPGANGSVPGPSQPRREDPYCEAHSSFGRNLPSTRQSYREKPGCPSCQEYRARYAGRTGEPESMGDLLARMGK